MISVIITTYNHAGFLGEAIESCLKQSWVPHDILVVDDGSNDEPEKVVAKYPGVRIVRQENQGLAAARNTGIRETTDEFVIFLDADDRLLPQAVEAGVRALRLAPEAAFCFGAYRYIDARGEVLSSKFKHALNAEPYKQLLRDGNIIGMHATVTYRREPLVAVGGFDVDLRACEDYDLFLRITRDRGITEHNVLVAEYRRHGSNMSLDRPYMLDFAQRVLAKQDTPSASADVRKALSEGRSHIVHYYAGVMARDGLRIIRAGERSRGFEVISQSLRMAPAAALRMMWRAAGRRLRRKLPGFLGRAVGASTYSTPRVGRVRYGDFGRTEPVSNQFGFDRGKPVDRYYVEGFLDARSPDIRGRVLEIGDNEYTLRFGGVMVEKSEVLHVEAGNPIATYVGDLCDPAVLPENTFDCVVLTQTLHLIFDMPKAIAALHRVLKPGGVLLLTVPGITPVDRDEWSSIWYWSLTETALRKLLELSFEPQDVEVGTAGNVFAACCFLQGLALEELPEHKLDVEDKAFPVIVSARAVKQQAAV